MPMHRDDINRYLASFAEDPAEVMDRQPEKRSPEGGALTEAFSAWDGDAIDSGDFVTQRDEVRAALYDVDASGGTVRVDDIVSGKAPIEKHDRAQDLCDSFKYE